ncbi:DNA excision repair protein ERCC-6-like [Liolophura sinensis]|uniref:DNA excision repair protein ERCC-6-like n=1 Tax=Liolophura sinensis TaxID=3198878 RepID=UPI0031593E5C
MEVAETRDRLANLSISGTPHKHGSETTRVRLPSGEEKDVSHSDQARFNKFITKGKQLANEGRIREALDLNRQALKIYHSEKLAKRIAKMEAYLKEYGEEDGSEDDGDDTDAMKHVGDGFYLYKDLYEKLYSHQKAGVLWLWGLHQKGKGGILGDDMGLGKTIQVISFLSGMFDADKVKTVLVVLPVSLMSVWERELDKWAPGIRVVSYHGTSKKEREKGLAKIQKRGGVCLTTYGLVVSSSDKLGQDQDGHEFKWDYIILDEGHKIKNPTKTAKGVRAIGAEHRIILTGTPIQNNLQELWALFDFVHHGALLGTSRTFKMEYDTPITRARERDATAGEKRLGSEMAESLKRIISPFFLRRTKAEVTAKGGDKENDDPDAQDSKSEKVLEMPRLTRKNDLIIWLFLTDAQKKIYEDFISLDDVKELLMTHKSPLVALTVLKKLCDHLRLLSTRACIQLGLTADEKFDVDDLDTDQGLQCAANRIQFIPDDVLINESGKMIFLVELLDNLKENGHRCLVFSQSTKMLNIIQKVIANRGHKVMRLDGSVIQVSERQERISRFQKDNSYSVFLLTTQVGGVGLTLTSADRVVIYDPSWNPATDAQAVDRVFRIGQDKNVVIYRLITCGTVEEKIYRRQVFKDSITRQTTGNAKNPYRYFTKQELRELFSLDNAHFSTTQKQLEEMHGAHRSSDCELDAHIAYLHSLDIFGISDHDLMFNVDPEEEATCVEGENDYIQSRVLKAQQLLHMESNLSSDIRAQMEKNPRAMDVDPSLKTNQPPRPRPPKAPQMTPFGEVIILDSPSKEGKRRSRSPKPAADHQSAMYQNLSDDEQVNVSSSSVGSLHSGESGINQQVLIKQEPIKEETEEHDEYMGSAGSHGYYRDADMADEEFDNKENVRIIPDLLSSEFGMNALESEQKPLPAVNCGTSPRQESRTPGMNVLSDTTNMLMASPSNMPQQDKRSPRALHRTPVSVSATPKCTPRTHGQTPRSVNQTPGTVGQTPRSANRTPNFQRLIKEEIIISPDASRPIIKIEPSSPEERQPPCPPRRFRHNSSDPITCVLDLQPDELPEVNDSPLRNPALYTTIVEDSPDTSDLQIRRRSNGRRQSRLSVGHPRAFTTVLDSVENSPAIDGESGQESPNVVTMVTESDEEVIGDSGSEEVEESSLSVSATMATDVIGDTSNEEEDEVEHGPQHSSSSPDPSSKTRPKRTSLPAATKGQGRKSGENSSKKTTENTKRNSLTGGARKSTESGNERSVGAGKRQSLGPGKRQSLGPGRRQSLGTGNRQSLGGGKRQSSGAGKRQSLGGGKRQSSGAGNRRSTETKAREPVDKQRQSGRKSLPGKKSKKDAMESDDMAEGSDSIEQSEEDSDGPVMQKKASRGRRRVVTSSEDEEEADEMMTKKNSTEKTKKSKGAQRVESSSEFVGDSEDAEGTEDEEGEDIKTDEDSFIDDEDEVSESSSSEGSTEAGSSEGEEFGSEDDYDSEDDDFDEEEDPVPEEKRDEFFKLYTKARKLYKSRKYEEALVPLLKAIQIYPDPELQAMALKIHKKVKS